MALWQEEKPAELTLTKPYSETFFPAMAGGQGVNAVSRHAQRDRGAESLNKLVRTRVLKLRDLGEAAAVGAMDKMSEQWEAGAQAPQGGEDGHFLNSLSRS